MKTHPKKIMVLEYLPTPYEDIILYACSFMNIFLILHKIQMFISKCVYVYI